MMKAYVTRTKLASGAELYGVRLEEGGRTMDLDCHEHHGANELLRKLKEGTSSVVTISPEYFPPVELDSQGSER